MRAVLATYRGFMLEEVYPGSGYAGQLGRGSINEASCTAVVDFNAVGCMHHVCFDPINDLRGSATAHLTSTTPEKCVGATSRRARFAAAEGMLLTIV